MAKTSIECANEKRGRLLEMLRLCVYTKIHYWDALKRLEDALTGEDGFTDNENNDIIEQIDTLAAGSPTNDFMSIMDNVTAEHLKDVLERLE